MSNTLKLIALMWLCSCMDSQTIANELQYTKDHRTDLCFAIWCPECQKGRVMANVPCTAEVERLLVK